MAIIAFFPNGFLPLVVSTGSPSRPCGRLGCFESIGLQGDRQDKIPEPARGPLRISGFGPGGHPSSSLVVFKSWMCEVIESTVVHM